MEDARRRRFDVLLVEKRDRLPRSLRVLLNALSSLGTWGIDFISYNDRNLDKITPTGKLI
jgi:DNA invertase Pin-like site-specific DNA recombinase